LNPCVILKLVELEMSILFSMKRMWTMKRVGAFLEQKALKRKHVLITC